MQNTSNFLNNYHNVAYYTWVFHAFNIDYATQRGQHAKTAKR